MVSHLSTMLSVAYVGDGDSLQPRGNKLYVRTDMDVNQFVTLPSRR